ncbi:MAG: hypothetical protein HOE86_27370 [Gemmatimonadetes bacterium]|nr:hypothetical protein [Gemmatimonadota bacterium]
MTNSPISTPGGTGPRTAQCVVPILGMHRSGTSMFTRALQLVGLDLGEPLLGPQPDNPKGFWENEFFLGADLQILRAIQRHDSGYGRRDDLLQIPGISSLIERTDQNLQAINDYIQSQFAQTPVWGWKDPRTVLLFPFWLSTLVELGIRCIRPMIITRDPSSCVRSLVARPDLDPLAQALGMDKHSLALEMWVAYSHILLDIAIETDAYISLQEWFMDTTSARSEIERAADVCGAPNLEAGLDDAVEWLDPGSVHHREPDALTGPLGEEALDLYGILLSRARRQRAAWRGRFEPTQLLSSPEFSADELTWTARPAATSS